MSDDIGPFHFNNLAFLLTQNLLLMPQKRLDRAAFVHRAVTFGHLFQRQRQVEHLAGVDVSVQS